MALGRSHDKYNLIIGSIVLGILVNFNHNWEELALFSVGFIFSTLIFSPDADLGPKKRSKYLAPFLYPYSFFFKHRGLSHSIFFGTLTRILYLIIVFFVVYIIFFRMGDINEHPLNMALGFKKFILDYNLEMRLYRNLTYLFVGMLFADILHIFLDRLSSFMKRLFKTLF